MYYYLKITNMINSIELESIQQSPMFRMSLGSKELFHSNFLQYVLEISPELTKKLFDIKGEYEVLREYNNFDLLILDLDSHEAIIIENKFKAIPENHQLDRYSTKTRSNSLSVNADILEYKTDKRNIKFNIKCKILLCPYEISHLTDGWQYLSYEKLLKHYDSLKLDDKNELILNDYITFTKILVKNLKSVQCKISLNSTLEDIDFDKFPILRKLRIYDLFAKVSHTFALELIIKELEKTRNGLHFELAPNNMRDRRDHNDKKGVYFKNSSFIRATALLEIICFLKNDSAFFVQIQNKSLKLMFQSINLRDKVNLLEKNKEILFDFNEEIFKHKFKKVNFQNEFNKYDYKDRYDIRYKYRLLEPKTTLAELTVFFNEKLNEIESKKFQEVLKKF